MQKDIPALAAIGRVLIAVFFILPGVSKVTTPAETQAYIASVGLPLPMVSYFVALAVELGCGLLLLIGFRTRFAAAVLALFCLVTAAFFHNHFADKNQLVNFMKNMMLAGGLLQIVAFGAPTFSFDARGANKQG